MYWLLLVVFILGYILIALEHVIKVDKAASAILTGVVCWTVLMLGRDALLGSRAEFAGHPEAIMHFLDAGLLEQLGEIAEILFFLLGAMTIIELIDAHEGFRVVTDRIRTTSRVKLLWLVCGITFFFSAALDNLTTAIVMSALLKKLLSQKEDLYVFGGMVIIAANAGGAWSPIGDVTTIMLWISGQITTFSIMRAVFLPSLVCLLAPLLVLTRQLKGTVEKPVAPADSQMSDNKVKRLEQHLVFWLGLAGLLFVPVFKNITHLPPFMGMLMSLGVLWIITSIVHRNKDHDLKHEFMVGEVIRRIDTPSILFFLGILLAVASLQTAGHLGHLALALDQTFGNIYIINTLIGMLSAVVDNVPLVAGAIGMYPMSTYPQDHTFWQLLAYCAGTGGSILIIGSAAGVAIMGLLKIDFIWYLRRISGLALIGYLAGVLLLYLIG